MDLNDFWQENKRFLTIVGSGALVYLIAWSVISGLYSSDILSLQRDVGSKRRELSGEMYTADDLDRAQAENDALVAAYDHLEGAVAFRPRPAFSLDGAQGNPSNQYFTVVERVREELAVRAGRNRALLPPGLDLEMLKTNNVATIERHLEALDVVDRAVNLAIDAGVKRVRRIRVELDPGFRTRKGIGPVERTKVQIEVVGDPEAVTRWIASTQDPAHYGQPLVMLELESRLARTKQDELTARVVFGAVRINDPREAEVEEEA